MSNRLVMFWCIYVADSDADALALDDYVERVAIDHMRYPTVERRGTSVQCEQQDGQSDQTQMGRFPRNPKTAAVPRTLKNT